MALSSQLQYPGWVSGNFVCMTSRRLLGTVTRGQAGVKLAGTVLSVLTSLRGHWGMPGPGQVVVRGRESTPVMIREDE